MKQSSLASPAAHTALVVFWVWGLPVGKKSVRYSGFIQ